MEGISLLEQWYSGQCNGDWEHSYGVEIDTLDNPGWTIKIDLAETKAASRTLERVFLERSEDNWIQCQTENKKKQFQIACGPTNLSEAVRFFVDWFEGRRISLEEAPSHPV